MRTKCLRPVAIADILATFTLKTEVNCLAKGINVALQKLEKRGKGAGPSMFARQSCKVFTGLFW